MHQPYIIIFIALSSMLFTYITSHKGISYMSSFINTSISCLLPPFSFPPHPFFPFKVLSPSLISSLPTSSPCFIRCNMTGARSRHAVNSSPSMHCYSWSPCSIILTYASSFLRYDVHNLSVSVSVSVSVVFMCVCVRVLPSQFSCTAPVKTRVHKLAHLHKINL